MSSVLGRRIIEMNGWLQLLLASSIVVLGISGVAIGI
jgi:hypothetical protein